MNAQDLKLDYFKLYDVMDHRVEYWLTLQGQFDEEPEKAELLALSAFATSVSKNQEPIYNRHAHLTWYWLHQPIPEPARMVVVENQFGQQKILIGKPGALLAPAQKRERGSQFPVELAHFKVYRVLESEPITESVALRDQFGSEEARVFYPFAFGVPVKKEYQGKDSRLHNEKAHLVLYRITPRSWRQGRVVRDQFGTYYLYFLRSVGLAVPSLKQEWNEMD